MIFNVQHTLSPLLSPHLFLSSLNCPSYANGRHLYEKMSLYHEAAEILTSSSDTGGSLKSRVFGKKKGKAPPGQLYALVLETAKWSPVLKEVIEKAGILRLERKVSTSSLLFLVSLT